MEGRKFQGIIRSDNSFSKNQGAFQPFQSIGTNNKSDYGSFEKEELNDRLRTQGLMYPTPIYPPNYENKPSQEELYLTDTRCSKPVSANESNNTIYQFLLTLKYKDQLMQPAALQQNTSSQLFPNTIPWYLTQSFSNQFQKQTNENQNNPFLLSQNSIPGNSMAAQLNLAFSNKAQHQTPNYQVQNNMKDGMRVVCEIDLLFLRKFYSIKNKVFSASNTKESMLNEICQSNAEWIKNRFDYHFETQISQFLQEMVDKVEFQRDNKIEDDIISQQKVKTLENSQILYQLEGEISSDVNQRKQNILELINQIEALLEQFLLK